MTKILGNNLCTNLYLDTGAAMNYVTVDGTSLGYLEMTMLQLSLGSVR
jgi:hypothetical protein